MFHLAAETSLFQCSKRCMFLNFNFYACVFDFLGQKTWGEGNGAGTVPRPLPMLQPCGLFRLLNKFVFWKAKNEKKKNKTIQLRLFSRWFSLHILHIKSTYINVVGVIRHVCLQKPLEMLPKCSKLFHKFYKIRNCFKF